MEPKFWALEFDDSRIPSTPLFDTREKAEAFARSVAKKPKVVPLYAGLARQPRGVTPPHRIVGRVLYRPLPKQANEITYHTRARSYKCKHLFWRFWWILETM